MSLRLRTLENYKSCPIRKSIVKNFKQEDWDICSEFIKNHDHLNYSDFLNALNQWGLGIKDKDKNFFRRWQIVSEANGILRTRSK